MKKMGKRILALALTLCLVLALGTTAHAAVSQITATVGSGEAQAGKEITTINVNTDGDSFNSPLTEDLFTVDGTGVGLDAELKIQSVSGEGTATATLTMESPIIPLHSGDLSVTAKSGAFSDESAPPAATISVTAAGKPTLSVTSSNLTAGKNGGTIQLSITSGGNEFAGDNKSENYKVTGLSVTSVAESTTTATLTVSGTPSAGGNVTVTVEPAGFKYQPGESATASANVKYPTVTATASAVGDSLTVGVEGEITIQASGSDFASTNPDANLFTLTGGGAQHPTSVTATGSQATLKVTPTGKSDITGISIDQSAFKYAPENPVSISQTITVKSPTVTASASGELTQGKAGGSIEITATGSDFISDPTGKFSFEGAGANGLSVTSVTGGGSNKVTLTMSAPTNVGDVTVKITADAFKYQPDTQVSASGASVIAPTGNVTATLTGELYAGTQVNGQTIEVTVDNDLSLNSAVKSNFQLSGAGSDGLDFTASGSGTMVTLSLTGTPNNPGEIKVKVLSGAFVYPPSGSDVEATSSITVKNAPTVTMQEASMVAGDTDTVDVTIQTPGVNFASVVDGSTLQVSGDEGFTDITVTNVSPKSTSATLTLSKTPTKAGSMTIQIPAAAFNPVALGAVNVTVTVSDPTEDITASCSGLVAGQSAAGKTIALTASGKLHFKTNATKDKFQLETGAEGLTIENVSITDTTATLTLSGTPAKAGSFNVKALAGAFTAESVEETSTNKINIGYPTIKLTANPNHLVEDDNTVKTIKLTVDGSEFVETNQSEPTGNFTFEGYTDITLASVTAAAGSKEATLTFTGTPEQNGSLKINVKPDAFKYKPESDASVTVSISQPTGNLSAKLNGNLYAGTSADGTTITLTITGSQGLHFKDPGLTPEAFSLVGTGTDGLEIKSVARDSETQATLTLSGTPTASGSFQVKALKDSAFMAAPADDKISTESITVGDPNVALTVSDNTLQAGAKDSTVTLTLTGSTFADDLTDKVTLVPGEDYADDDLSIEVNKEDDTTVTVTVKGVPSVMGKISFEFKTDAFTPAPTAAVTVAVDVAKGEQAAEAEANPGAPGIGFTAPLDQLAAAVLTPDEQALYEKGAEVKIELVESVGAQIPQTDKTAVEAAVGDYTVGEYLDVSLVKSVNGVTGDITETKTPIQVVFTIPTDLRAANRSFAVIRVHDGTATLLEPVASTAETITVESSLFSTYAIVYREVVPTPTPTPAATETPAPTEAPATPTEAPVEPTETPETTEAPDTTEAPEATDAPAEPTATPAGTEAPKAPETGDGFMPGLWMGLLAVCAAGLVLTLIQLRRRSRG